jgi:indolepyruvate ferredoxin oxidoreductase
VAEAVGTDNTTFSHATELATALFGDAIATNSFLVGVAYQKGLMPVSVEALNRAIELNGVAVEMNKRALAWGRLAAVEPDTVAREALAVTPTEAALTDDAPRTLDDIVERRGAYLTAYQNEKYAARYRDLVSRVGRAESAIVDRTDLAQAVARGAFKLMAYKDEYEVARLYTDGHFLSQVRDTFDGDYRLRFHLAPPLFARRDPGTGHLVKGTYGGFVMTLFKVLANARYLRGTPFDPFGHTAERRDERRLIEQYFETVEMLLAGLTRENHATAVEIAALPERIRGFGHVKERNLKAARDSQATLLEQFRGSAILQAAE